MVYCGKPSKGCQACRQRKTRCDRQTPSCTQCIRAHRDCPGYRNELDLMFRNESEAVIGRARIKKTPKAKSSSPKSSPQFTLLAEEIGQPETSNLGGDAFNFSSYQLDYHRPFVSVSLGPTIQDRALGFFNSSSGIWLRNFDLVDFICNQSNTDDYLLASMSAVGLAGYSSSVRVPELMTRARKDYVTALQLTNSALRSPTEFKKDSTLFSVMALGVFEAIAGTGEESLAAWGRHLSGATELVKLRGPEQFRTEAGQRMFLQVTSNLMVDCVQRAKPMPAHIIKLREYAKGFMGPENPAWNISSTIIEFTILRANVKQHKLIDARKIVDTSLAIDRSFLDIFQTLPPEWYHQTVYTNDAPDMVWNGKYHIYNNIWVAQMYNAIRTFRIHLHEMIREQLPAVRLDLTPIFSEAESSYLLRKSIDAMLDMQAGILASIPQHAPWGRNNKPSSSIEDSRAYFILWPLYLAGVMDMATAESRAWVMNRLRSIGESVGIEHATILADSMVRRQRAEIWDKTKPVPQLQKLDPLDWNMDGWAVAHGAILAAQINRSEPRGQSSPID